MSSYKLSMPRPIASTAGMAENKKTIAQAVASEEIVVPPNLTKLLTNAVGTVESNLNLTKKKLVAPYNATVFFVNKDGIAARFLTDPLTKKAFILVNLGGAKTLSTMNITDKSGKQYFIGKILLESILVNEMFGIINRAKHYPDRRGNDSKIVELNSNKASVNYIHKYYSKILPPDIISQLDNLYKQNNQLIQNGEAPYVNTPPDTAEDSKAAADTLRLMGLQ